MTEGPIDSVIPEYGRLSSNRSHPSKVDGTAIGGTIGPRFVFVLQPLLIDQFFLACLTD
jgi:hypothetical protein